jgi:hypothetical protein
MSIELGPRKCHQGANVMIVCLAERRNISLTNIALIVVGSVALIAPPPAAIVPR